MLRTTMNENSLSIFTIKAAIKTFIVILIIVSAWMYVCLGIADGVTPGSILKSVVPFVGSVIGTIFIFSRDGVILIKFFFRKSAIWINDENLFYINRNNLMIPLKDIKYVRVSNFFDNNNSKERDFIIIEAISGKKTYIYMPFISEPQKVLDYINSRISIR